MLITFQFLKFWKIKKNFYETLDRLNRSTSFACSDYESGGLNEMSNLQVLCAECNLGKSNRDDTAFGDSVDDTTHVDTM